MSTKSLLLYSPTTSRLGLVESVPESGIQTEVAAVKTILHVIDSLDRAGAELIFLRYINALPADYENVVVYLRKPDTLVKELVNVKKVYALNYHNKYSLIKVVTQLRRIIQAHNIQLIHAHLFWSTLACRLAKPSRVPLVFHVHNQISLDAFKPNRLSLWAEKLTYSPRQTAVFVSEGAMADYARFINVAGNSFVLPNFVAEPYFLEENKVESFSKEELNLVAVGHLRKQKNYGFLLACMAKMKDQHITLDIYGEGPEHQEIAAYIEQQHLTNVRLLGVHQAPEEMLKNYDAFILASEFEGFCVAMAEAMAVGLPCIVSDIDVLREISGGEQVYFQLNDPEMLITQLRKLSEDKGVLQQLSSKAKKTAVQYNINSYIQRLCNIYDQSFQRRGEHD